jgi:hypothetical protein
VNGYHVHAVGWILVCYARAFTAEEARGLTRLWEDVIHSHAEDVGKASAFCRLMRRRSINLSGTSLKALALLVRSIVSLHPERFGTHALRSRRNSWFALTLLGFGLSILSATLPPRSWPLLPEVVPTLFLLGCISTLPAVLLWRATSAVTFCSEKMSGAWATARAASRQQPAVLQPGNEMPVTQQSNERAGNAARGKSEKRTGA